MIREKLTFKYSPKFISFGIGIILLIAAVSYFTIGIGKDEGDREVVLLNANVKLNGNKIEIENNDTFDYVYTILSINEKYTILRYNLPAGEKHTLWQIEFSDRVKHVRMDNRAKVHEFSILCDLDDGRRGCYHIKF